MRCTNINIRGIGTEIGRISSVQPLIESGIFTASSAKGAGQRSVALSSDSGPEMAVAAARRALAAPSTAHDMTGDVGFHLHASIWERADFSSVACSVHQQLGLQAAFVTEVNAMSNSMILAVELVAGILHGRTDMGDALVTAGERFAAPRFPRFAADFGMVYGDAGAALLLSRRSGFARIRSIATVADTTLAGLNQHPTELEGTGSAPLDLRARKRRWFAEHCGPREVAQRSAAAVQQVVARAVDDAGVELHDARWIAAPFFGEQTVREQYLDPLRVPRQRTLIDLGLRLGHLGAADNVVALEHLWENGKVEAGDITVLISSGVGMTWSAAVVEFTSNRTDEGS